MFKKKDAPAESGGKKDKGKLLGSMKTSMSSALAQAKTGTKNTQQTVKIQLTQQKLVDAKHKFGVEYMDLMLQGAAEDQLELCVETHWQEVQRLVGKLDKYQGIISDNKQKLEQKLAKQAGQPPPHTQPSLEVTEASTNAAEAASFPDLEATSSAASTSNPFDDSDDVVSKSMPAAPAVAIPMAEAIPVSDTNNPFDDDDDKKPSPAKAISGSNSRDDDSKPKSNSANPFDDDDEDDAGEATIQQPKSASVNPFDDDDDDDDDVGPPPAQSKATSSGSVNPFDD